MLKKINAMIDQFRSRGGGKHETPGSFYDSLHRVRAARCLRHPVRMDLSPRTLVNSPSTSCFFARRYPVRRVARARRFYRRKMRQAAASSRQLCHDVREGGGL